MPAQRIALGMLLALPSSMAAILGPYQVDPDTVHLFHLDETPGSTVAANAVPGAPPAIAFDGATLLNHATNPQPAATHVLGQASGPPGFGNAASIPLPTSASAWMPTTAADSKPAPPPRSPTRSPTPP